MQPRDLTFVILAVIPYPTLAAQALSAAAATGQASGRLPADTPKATALGNAFMAPKDWSLGVKGAATILEAPEGNSWIALVDVRANNAEQALAAAWKVYKPEAKWPVKVSNDLPDKDGWTRRREYGIPDLAQRKARSGRARLLLRVELDRCHRGLGRCGRRETRRSG